MTKVSFNNLWGWKLDNSHIKLLSVYYSTEKFFKNGLAAPLIGSIRPVIGVQEHSYSLIVEKALPNLVNNVNPDKLLNSLRKRFSKIDSGAINPMSLLGHEFTADQIVEQVKVHDTFNALYKKFFEELTIQRFEVAEIVRENVAFEITSLNEAVSTREMRMLRDVFSADRTRSPLSLDLDVLLEVIDTLHEVTAISSTTAIADSVLSKAVMETTKITSDFDAKVFL